MLDLSVVIVSWNVRNILAACLESIAGSPILADAAGADIPGEHSLADVEVIVVDSASDDGTPEMIREQYPWVQLIQPGYNVGFTAGNNLGIRASQGRNIMLLNPDTEVIGDALPKLVRYLEHNLTVGVVGPQLLNADGTVQSSRRRFPTMVTALFESTWLQPCAPRRVLDRYYVRDQDDSETLPVDWVTGAALMVKREVIEQVGLLDESFFMYSEELDWQKRIKAAGWDVVYYPPAQIIHLGGKSSDQVAAQRHIYFQSSKVRYFRKHHGQGAGAALWGFLMLSYTWQLLLEATKGLLGHKRDMRLERVRAYWQVLRSGLHG